MDKRLLTAAGLVRSGNTVCDVGTDHAYLPVWLVEQGICPAALACDVNESPLTAARHTVEEHGVSDKIRLILSDGLREVPSGAAQDIVMAGMGGELIVRLLLECSWSRNPALRFVLQPMTRSEALRAALCKNGFAIEREIPVIDGQHRYTVLSVSYCGKAWQPNDLFCRTGKIPQEHTAESAVWLLGEAERERKIAAGLRQSQGHGNEAQEHDALANQIEQLINWGGL